MRRNGILPVIPVLLLVAIVRCEMRKSWQTKSDVQVELLRAARLEESTVAGDKGEPVAPVLTATTPDGDLPVKKPTFSSRLRSTYVLNRTAGHPPAVATEGGPPEVKQLPLQLEDDHLEDIEVDDITAHDDDDEDDDDEDDDFDLDGKFSTDYGMIENILEEVGGETTRQTEQEQKHKKKHKKTVASSPVTTGERREPLVTDRLKSYTFPPVLNMTIDEPNSIVNVKLNEEIIRGMFTGRGEGGGGGKKMLRYVIPLFILPFLIQSAIIPFMLTTVKLFLVKSFLAGKMAIFLLLLGAFKNFTKKEREVYAKDLPERRYEPSSEGFGYLAEGRPSSWVH